MKINIPFEIVTKNDYIHSQVTKKMELFYQLIDSFIIPDVGSRSVHNGKEYMKSKQATTSTSARMMKP
ncbi:hypothetical protein DERP_000018 [Dermatophagoides pteronyssinus]|uniref:Uncharacterized protein n=1 Tax=Dermatophagoides pteronyssinus TaxID=6956 RepID=A0ABQ8IZ15_DERPT|nr:hypothetical protein DERP_000018 [Dermatophagoides pteronyssinus]